ncbi:Ribosomal protein S5 domain 2-type fold [Pseudocohnilembus persalinus]|uniref:phosphomevalonate kinase n=1 Tax=Pseudocohnilembus persalinus TaxID=266149 RepID=A0A0V0QBI5_PSEPJ|nr:Ribosomal protein S5 domain 2-type fold [Pseudocohnilembus persalinus]|eukprot:KRW99577.1 Ribosomal protein S5 domain 2-type fold [Pseudocohnilembus persalinus]
MIQNNFQIYSCPSKTLILGGYAIMNPKCSGISIGLEERFYTVIYKNNNNINNNENLNQQDNQQNEITFTFSSPQINSEWIYNFNISEQQLNQINTDKEKSNPFLESTLKSYNNVSSFLGYYKYKETKLENIKIEIYFDSGFYSEKSQIQDKQISKKFKNFDKNNLQKSGLGSSACVIVSVLSALLNYHDIKSNQILEILSQIANIEAQKKVGSGFDIKTSIYGSNIYTMFSKESIMNLNLDQAFKINKNTGENTNHSTSPKI